MVWVTWPARNIGEAPLGGNSVKAKHASGAALSKHGNNTFVFRDGMVWSAVTSHADTILSVCIQQHVRGLIMRTYTCALQLCMNATPSKL